MAGFGRAPLHRALLVLGPWALLACAHEAEAPPVAGDEFHVSTPLPGEAEVSESKRPGLCAREGADFVRDVFCAEQRPSLRSLADLRHALRLGGGSPSEGETSKLTDKPTQHVFLTHSTALSGQLVSPINPRMFALGSDVVLAFNRGIQQVELAVRDRDSQRVKFYLLRFEQACSTDAHGCSPGDLYTPSIEADWTRVALQDDEELKNTPSDCRQCHQRGVAEPLLLMRELEGPWTHFFSPAATGTSTFPEPAGTDLLRDYLLAKGDEGYGGVPTNDLRMTIGFTLQSLVDAVQPLVFEGAVISNERWPWSPEGYPPEAQRSATWDAEYAAFKRGERLSLPYFAPRATDADKQSQLTAAYRSFQNDELGADELPELSDIYPDDPQVRAEIGLQTEPGATPAQLLIQACGSCHNDVLDQTISRARFNVALGRIGAAERELAIARIHLPRAAAGAMPPLGTRQLDVDARTRLVEYLKRTTRPGDDDAQLEHAAALGMALPPEERTQ
jgi:hypothetical protein